MMKKINFLATDGIILNGLLYESKEKTKKVILAVHGMSSNCFKKRDEIIANEANQNNIDYFCFNNRGSELVKYIRKDIDGKQEKILGGTAYEDVLNGYEDIVGAILKLKELGYTNIYLQGHSLGSTKILYTYNELKEENDDILQNIKAVILLSLIDISNVLRNYLGEEFDKYLQIAEDNEQQGKILELMPKEAFIHPISVKTFLRYAKNNKEIDFARYSQEDYEFKELNNISVPLFMRWGNKNEMIIQTPSELVNKLNNSIKNKNKDINYIDGADHGYNKKEEILANQIITFLKKI